MYSPPSQQKEDTLRSMLSGNFVDPSKWLLYMVISFLEIPYCNVVYHLLNHLGAVHDRITYACTHVGMDILLVPSCIYFCFVSTQVFIIVWKCFNHSDYLLKFFFLWFQYVFLINGAWTCTCGVFCHSINVRPYYYAMKQKGPMAFIDVLTLDIHSPSSLCLSGLRLIVLRTKNHL